MHIKCQLPVPPSSVTSACLDPSRPHVYCGLSSGQIQVWDYGRIGHMLGEMMGHCGPVRGVTCHHTMKLMASCSDDMRVIVWNTTTHKYIFTLRGHTDYVRQVHFHPTYPWLVTASDDCTIRIWNWQARGEVYTVTGHQHWVVSLSLHYTRDIMVSASLDGSVRLWDFSSLRNRTCSVGDHTGVSSLFGLVEVVCTHVWEEFTGKLGWVVFHPNMEMVAVGEGRMIKLFSTVDYREVGSLVGHKTETIGGVWGLGGEGIRDSLVTVSKDKKVKVWNYHSGLCRATHDTDSKFVGVMGHPRVGYLVGWGDKGVTVFKLWKERPPMAVYMHHLYYVKNGVIRHLNVNKNKEKVLVTLTGVKESQLISLEYNTREHALIVNSSVKGSNHSYQLFFIIEGANVKPKISKSAGRSSVWASHNRFALLDKNDQLMVKNLDNQNVNFAGFSTGFLLPKSDPVKEGHKIPICEKLFAGGRTGCVLMKDGNSIIHYDILKKRRLSSGQFDSVKHIIWSEDKSLLALFSKHQLWLCDKNLKLKHSVKLQTSIKSAVWCEDTTNLLYTTENQLMYLLASGDQGLVCTISQPLYLAMVRGSQVICLTRQAELKVLDINPAEFQFKAAVLASDEANIKRLISSGQLTGQSMLQFLRSVGRPELALTFIQDPLSSFCLAMESNNLSCAFAAANSVDNQDCWDRLASMAMLNGELAMAESCYQKSRNYTKLMFIYLATGQRDKLTKLARIMRVKGDFSGVYQVHLITGNRKDGADLLEFGGQDELAKLMRSQKPGVLEPPEAVGGGGDNWPKLEENFKVTEKMSGTEVMKEAYRDELKDTLNNVSESISDCDSSQEQSMQTSSEHSETSGYLSAPHLVSSCQYSPPSPGPATDLEDTLSSLHNTYGIVNFQPLKSILLSLHVALPLIPCSPSTPSLSLSLPLTSSSLDYMLVGCHQLTTAGQFSLAASRYRAVLLEAALAKQVQLVQLCAAYVVTLSMEIERKKTGRTSHMEKMRQCQLAIFATKFPILPAHQVLTLRSAITVCMKAGNISSAKLMAKLLLDLSPSPDVCRLARSVLLTQQTGDAEHLFPLVTILNTSRYIICGGDFIVVEGDLAVCKLCCTKFGSVYRGRLCPVDLVARIGG